MRRAAVLALATMVFALPATVGAEAPSEQANNQPPAAAPALAPPPDQTAAGGRPLLSPEQEGRQGIVKGVLVQPFRDFGLVESKIPHVLIEAMADPYARVMPATCDRLTAEIQRLEGALGPDLDVPVNTKHQSNLQRGEGQAREASLDALRGTEQGYIPFDGAIRAISGADRHDHRVLAAIQAGSVRRAYLKGMGEVQHCGPPATPRHLAHPAAVVAEQDAKRR